MYNSFGDNLFTLLRNIYLPSAVISYNGPCFLNLSVNTSWALGPNTDLNSVRFPEKYIQMLIGLSIMADSIESMTFKLFSQRMSVRRTCIRKMYSLLALIKSRTSEPTPLP